MKYVVNSEDYIAWKLNEWNMSRGGLQNNISAKIPKYTGKNLSIFYFFYRKTVPLLLCFPQACLCVNLFTTSFYLCYFVYYIYLQPVPLLLCLPKSSPCVTLFTKNPVPLLVCLPQACPRVTLFTRSLMWSALEWKSTLLGNGPANCRVPVSQRTMLQLKTLPFNWIEFNSLCYVIFSKKSLNSSVHLNCFTQKMATCFGHNSLSSHYFTIFKEK